MLRSTRFAVTSHHFVSAPPVNPSVMTILTRGIRGAHRRQSRYAVARQLPPPEEALSSESDSDSESELGGSESSDSEDEGEEEEEEEELEEANPELPEEDDDDREEEEGSTPTVCEVYHDLEYKMLTSTQDYKRISSTNGSTFRSKPITVHFSVRLRESTRHASCSTTA